MEEIIYNEIDSKSVVSDLLNQTEWYHGTSIWGYRGIMEHGLTATFNRGENKPLDFGYGTYLSPQKEWAIEYAKSMLEVLDDYESKLNEAAVITFHVPVLEAIKNGFTFWLFESQNDQFAEFVMDHRANPLISDADNVDFIIGPMTDGNQINAIQQWKKRLLSRQQVIDIFKEPTGDWQLLLHSQRACDLAVPKNAYTLEGGVLDVSSYKRLR